MSANGYEQIEAMISLCNEYKSLNRDTLDFIVLKQMGVDTLPFTFSLNLLLFTTIIQQKIMDTEILLRFLLAALWGGIVGTEREYHSKSAGFRTMIMISMGACFFTIISQKLGAGNPDRLAAGIVTGIGFLGAGVIFRGDNRISGITTAATIWTVAAVGMGIGAGYYFASGCASVLIIIVLAVLPTLERKIDRLNLLRSYTIVVATGQMSEAEITDLFESHKLKYNISSESCDANQHSAVWLVHGHLLHHESFIAQLKTEKRILFFSY